MIREHLFSKAVPADKYFRWRGGDVSRLEGFSDAVFGFALTLLVVSLEVPLTLTDLLQTMRGFMAFAVCFAILSWIWYEHYIFFRRYGLQDALTIVLNALLLFLIASVAIVALENLTDRVDGVFSLAADKLGSIF